MAPGTRGWPPATSPSPWAPNSSARRGGCMGGCASGRVRAACGCARGRVGACVSRAGRWMRTRVRACIRARKSVAGGAGYAPSHSTAAWLAGSTGPRAARGRGRCRSRSSRMAGTLRRSRSAGAAALGAPRRCGASDACCSGVAGREGGRGGGVCSVIRGRGVISLWGGQRWGVDAGTHSLRLPLPFPMQGGVRRYSHPPPAPSPPPTALSLPQCAPEEYTRDGPHCGDEHHHLVLRLQNRPLPHPAGREVIELLRIRAW